jgi:GTP pyrophosphokinase
VLVRFAKCCQPVPGDPVIGYITQGRGVTVHRVNCVNALKVNPDRQIEVEWNDTSTEETYPVKIHIIPSTGWASWRIWRLTSVKTAPIS